MLGILNFVARWLYRKDGLLNKAYSHSFSTPKLIIKECNLAYNPYVLLTSESFSSTHPVSKYIGETY